MATDLVRWGRGNGPDEPNDAETWDLPPDQPRGGPVARLGQRRRHRQAAAEAERDAEKARVRGDVGFAVMRETDASEHRQKAWDWGDARTWLIIAAMCLGFLAFCLFIYVLPYGRHNQNDGPMPTPPARYY